MLPALKTTSAASGRPNRWCHAWGAHLHEHEAQHLDTDVRVHFEHLRRGHQRNWSCMPAQLLTRDKDQTFAQGRHTSTYLVKLACTIKRRGRQQC